MSDINGGIPVDYAVPDDFIDLEFGKGPGGGGLGQYRILIIGNKTTAGSGTPDTVVYGPDSSPPVQTESDVIAVAGSGSEAYREWMQVQAVLALATTLGVTPPPVDLIFPTESAGTAASLAFAITGGAASAAAVNRFYCGTEFCDTQVLSGAVVDTIGANIATSINNQTRWPITASYNSGTDTITVTAKNIGPRGNEIRCWTNWVSGSPTTAIANAVSTPLASGATNDSWTAALSTILPSRYFYIVSPDTSVTDHTFDDLVTQVLLQSQPMTGIRQRVFTGFVGTQSAGSTIAANALINTELAQMFWLQTAERTAGEIAARAAAIHAVFESLDAAHNFRRFGDGEIRGIDTSKYWDVPAPQTRANWPTKGTGGSLNAALNNGMTPIDVTVDGRTFITWPITTRHKNGSNYDYRVRSSHIVSSLIRFADKLLRRYQQAYGGCKIIDDLKTGEEMPGVDVVQPIQIKALVFAAIDEEANKTFKQADKIKAGVEIKRNATNPNRVGIRIPARVIDLLLQGVFEIDDVSTAA